MRGRAKKINLFADTEKLFATGSYVRSNTSSTAFINTNTSQGASQIEAMKLSSVVDLNNINSQRVVPASLGLKVAGSKGGFFGWLSDLFTSFIALFKVTSSDQDVKPFYVDAPRGFNTGSYEQSTGSQKKHNNHSEDGVIQMDNGNKSPSPSRR